MPRRLRVGASGPPAWLTAAAPAIYEWVEIPNSAMSDNPPTVSPGPGALNAYGGLSIDTRVDTLWQLAGGGHSDGAANPAMNFNALADVPRWRESQASSVSADWVSNAAYYLDGRISASHPYYTQQFSQIRNRAMRITAVFVYGSAVTFPTVDGFDIDCDGITEGYDAAGTYPSAPPAVDACQVMCQDPSNEDIYVFKGNTGVWKVDGTTGAWTQHDSGGSFPENDEACTIFDAANNWVFGLSNTAAYTYNLSTGLHTVRTLTGAAAVAVMGRAKGGVLDPTTGCYFLRGNPNLAGDDTVYKIDPSTWAATVLPTTGGSGMPDVGIGGRSTYNKFVGCGVLPGILYIPGYYLNAWFLRTR